MERSTGVKSRNLIHYWAGGTVALVGLYATSLYSYLLFHTLVELFCVLTAFAVFTLAWNTRSIHDNHYLFFLGNAALFGAVIELLHALAYKGIGIFTGFTADLPTQLWIAFRYLFSLSLLLAPVFIKQSIHFWKIFTIYLVITVALLSAIFLGAFPACFIEGSGLTPFKIASEYIICLILLVSLALLFRNREAFDPTVFRLMVGSISASAASELAFAKYVSVYGPANMVGHFFLLASMVVVYRALVITGIVEPSRLLFRSIKISQEKIQALNAELRKHVLQLEAANKELEAFSYSVSHDLRAPLRSIDGFSQVLEHEYAGKLDGDAQEIIGRIRAATIKMGELIDALLNLARVSRCELRSVAVDMSELVKASADELRKNEPGRRVDFFIQEGIKARGDAVMLRNAVDNLVRNAWKFTGKVPNPRIEFGTVKNGGREEYFIRDNGAGFDMTYANKLFMPFQRLHAAADFPGVGIGLATVQRIIARHGGTIRAEGRPGEGAVFFIDLPNAPDGIVEAGKGQCPR